MSFLLLASLIWYSILLPTLPLEREIGPTVVDICFDWIGGVDFIALDSPSCSREVGLVGGGGLRYFLGWWSDNFLIGPL